MEAFLEGINGAPERLRGIGDAPRSKEKHPNSHEKGQFAPTDFWDHDLKLAFSRRHAWKFSIPKSSDKPFGSSEHFSPTG
jgi:hypothetical protein